MVGEIRDKETAEIGVKAALTGHLVISTLHTNDAPATIVRLVDMGIDPMYVGTSVLVVCAQRLLRRICKDCTEPYTPTDEDRAASGMPPEFFEGGQFKKGRGCPTCNGTGHRGRLAVHEVVGINTAIRKAIFDKRNLKELKTICMENGMQTMRQVGMADWKRGLTSLHEVLSETAPD
jgi:type IV pilus assembly protein PilB